MKGNILLALVIVVSILITILVLPLSAATTGWTRTYHGETTMDMLTPTSVIQTSDNGFALAVLAQAYHIDNVGYQGHFTTFYELQILKTDPTGQIQWARNFTEINDPNQQTPTITPSQSAIPTQLPSTSNTQPPLVDNTSNPFSTPTSSQQLNPTATGPQTTPAASGEQNPSTTQGTSDTTIIAAVIITITIVSLIALFVKFKHGKKAKIQ